MEIIELMDSEGNIVRVPVYDKEEEEHGIFMTEKKNDARY